VVGCARSGTSIFGEAIAAHPSAAYLFELSAMWNEVVEEGDDHRLDATDATDEIATCVYEALASAAKEIDERGAATVVVEKNPKHVLRLPFLDALFPWAKFVHIIRDGRDVTASLMFRNRRDQWGHLKVPTWRELLEVHPDANHVRCAHQWRIAVETARADGVAIGPERYLEVRYEELLGSPERVMTKVFDFIDLDVAGEAREFWSKIQDETAGSYHARKQVRHYVDNHSKRIGRFEENLRPEQIAEVEAICGPVLESL